MKSSWLLPGLLSLLAGACSRPADARPGTVVFASGADLQSINPLLTVHPLARQVQKYVLFLTLAGYDSSYRAVPRLAGWEFSSGRRTLTFHLRRDVKWHDGVPTTSDDVLWTLDAARAPEVGYPRRRDLDGVTAVEAPDSYTVRIRFKRPMPFFPDVLTDLPILPAHRFRGVAMADIRGAAFNSSPVGNGPFVFKEHLANQRWVFERNRGFPVQLGMPHFDRFVVAIVDESATKLAALTAGELDFAGINPAHAEFVRDDPDLDVISYPVLFSYALVWNLRRAPFDDIRVRRALTMAIDRNVLVAAHVYGFGTVAEGPVPPEHPMYLPAEPLPYDPDWARALLDSAGWVEGPEGIRTNGSQRLAFELLAVSSSNNPLEQMIQAQLREVGAAVSLRVLELSSFLARVQAERRDFDALVTGIPGDLGLSQVIAMYSDDPEGPLAYPGYHSARFDSLARKVARASVTSEVRQGWHGIQTLLREDLPTTWLYHARGVQGVNRRIRNVHMDLRGELAGMNRWVIRAAGTR